MKNQNSIKKIVIVEDEALMREELSDILNKAGYESIAIGDFSHVEEQIIHARPDMVLLDLNLPYKSGFEIVKHLKEKTRIPVLVLTSRDDMNDEISALHLGADDFLNKPCRAERLLARLEKLLTIYHNTKQNLQDEQDPFLKEMLGNMLNGGSFLLDKNTYTIYTENHSAVIPQNQGMILETLIHKNGEASKEELCHALWGTSEYIDPNALQVNMTRLKKTMKSLGIQQTIINNRGIGYTLSKMPKQEKGKRENESV